jgi:hypothetical protein
MSRKQRYVVWIAVALASFVLFGIGAPEAEAQQTRLIGRWQCVGQNDGIIYISSFDYQSNGRYTSTQRIIADDDMIEGGGGGSWRLEGDILHDTKEAGVLSRFIRDGFDVSPNDPEYQSLVAQSQTNIGQTSSGPIRLVGDAVMFSGMYTCHRQR